MPIAFLESWGHSPGDTADAVRFGQERSPEEGGRRLILSSCGEDTNLREGHTPVEGIHTQERDTHLREGHTPEEGTHTHT